MAGLTFRALDAVSEVERTAWDALLDAQATPFVRWDFLHALESSGCAATRAGWTPRHPTLWRDGRLVAAAPGYLKEDSDGDFSRDWDWAHAAQQAGLRYYPKLILSVPFTPCTGRRVLVAPDEDRSAAAAALLAGVQALCAQERLGSVHALFPGEADAAELERQGLAVRVSYQFHWHNRGYRTLDDFLARFNAKKRAMVRREMAAPGKQGISIRTVRGEELAADPSRWGMLAHDLHRSTVDKLMWGRRWLNAKFYQRVFAAMPDALELVIAEREGQVVAGAFNVRSATRLYGRYWGSFEDHPFLHFNVCYYHSIAECIANGTEVFEGGAGGEHKIARGFEPSLTYSAHRCQDPRLDAAVRGHLRAETPERSAAIERYRSEAGIFKKDDARGAP
ncbi:MAG: GNAT family N-acetyltransferase [Myxococcales bacterium]